MAGCVHGAACGRCHLCTWSKKSLKMEAAWTQGSAISDDSKPIVSIGSIGHPTQCAWPCRFMKRAAGCHNKVGRNWEAVHLVCLDPYSKWSRRVSNLCLTRIFHATHAEIETETDKISKNIYKQQYKQTIFLHGQKGGSCFWLVHCAYGVVTEATCSRCHLCSWSKTTLKIEAAAKRLQPAMGSATNWLCIPYQLISASDAPGSTI